MAKVIKCLAIALILIFTLVPASMHLSRIISGQSTSVSGENRALATWPHWDEADGDLAKYTKLVSSHFNDQFGGRTLAIRVRNKLFNAVGDGTASVLKGRTPGWYFYNSPYIEQSYRGAAPYIAADVEEWTGSLERLQNSVTANGAAFAAMIPPDKARIYPEHTPEKFGVSSSRRFAHDLVQGAQKRGLAMIDIDPVLMAAKNDGPIFYKTDTHWTLRGAYEAYAAVMSEFGRQGGDFSVLGREDITPVSRADYSGDLAVMMGLKGELTEALTDFRPPKPSLAFKKKTLTDPSITRAIWQTEIYDNGRENPRTLIIIGDSFSRQLFPYFQHSFDKIVFVHHRRGEFDLTFVLRENPDAIFFAPVERETIRMQGYAKAGDLKPIP